jgi:hypothetical protein
VSFPLWFGLAAALCVAVLGVFAVLADIAPLADVLLLAFEV